MRLLPGDKIVHLYRIAMYNPVSPMFTSRHLKRDLALVATLCTLSIFLFTAPSGPYSAVHGPVTGLRALHVSFAILWSIAIAAWALDCRLVVPYAAECRFGSVSDLLFLRSLCLSTELRC
jgi:hypothetical protein